MYTCGLTVYARGHIGNFRTFVALDVLRRVLQVRGLRRPPGPQLHRRGRPDDRGVGESGRAAARVHAAVRRGVRTGRRRARARAGRRGAARDRPNIDAMAGMIQALEKNGHTYASDGSIYFKICDFPRVRPAGAARSRRHQERRARRRRQVRQGERPRLRAVEGGQSRVSRRGSRGCRPGRPGLAHRVLGDGRGAARRPPRHPRRRRRPRSSRTTRTRSRRAEGATGTPFARFWVHVEHLMIDEKARRCRSRSATSTASRT